MTEFPRDPTGPLTDYEKYLLEKLLSPENLPTKLKAWIVDHVSINAKLNVSDMPSLKGEDWHYVDGNNSLGVSFTNSWVNFDADRPARFYKDVLGIVHLDGILKGGTVGAAAFTLPSGYRPVSPTGGASYHFPAASNAAYGELVVVTSGVVQPNNGSNVYFSLCGISFRA